MNRKKGDCALPINAALTVQRFNDSPALRAAG
jgi:hypothetical protein